jgi:hypothetical protein
METVGDFLRNTKTHQEVKLAAITYGWPTTRATRATYVRGIRKEMGFKSMMQW